MNDIILIGDVYVEIELLRWKLTKEFEIKDLGQLYYFLGMEVSKSKKGIFISQ